MLQACALSFFLLLLLAGCSTTALHSSSAMVDDARKDYLYLLENLNDGKVAIWRDSRGIEHHFAVFSTYAESNNLCRDYFNTSIQQRIESDRVFGTSCRISAMKWQYVRKSEASSRMHYLEFMRLEAGFHASFAGSDSTTGQRRGISYPSRYTLSPFLSQKSKAAEAKYGIALRSMIDDASRQQNFHPCLIHAIVFYESGYNPNAASPCCAGLMQLGKAAAKEVHVVNRKDPRQNLTGGSRYLQKKLNEQGINKNISLALASYNCGYGTIKNNNFQIPQRCWSNNPRHYVSKILSKFKQCN